MEKDQKGPKVEKAKNIVTEELAALWLEQAERYGKNPSQIAREYDFDVRTVRKHLDLKRRALEKKEARQHVLRAALEAHQADLCSFAERLKKEITLDSRYPVSPALTQDLLWEALRKHTPRSYLWRRLERWNDLAPQMKTFEAKLEEKLANLIASNTRLKFDASLNKPSLNPGFTMAVVDRLERLALDKDFPDVSIRSEPGTGGLVHLKLGNYSLALTSFNQAGLIQELFDSAVKEGKRLPEYQRLAPTIVEFAEITKNILNELEGIKLRRLLPGSCLYCPC